MGNIDAKEAMIDQIKVHWLVRVNDGTGIIVSPLDDSILYIFTCKHVILDNNKLLSKESISVRYDEHTSRKNHTFEIVDVFTDDCEKDVAIIVAKRDLDNNLIYIYHQIKKNAIISVSLKTERR